MAALYSSRLKSFLETDPNHLLGLLVSGLADEGFDTTKLTTASWQQEISELQEALRPLPQTISCDGGIHILLEYILPIIGQRLDCVLLINNIIFLIEYKGGCSAKSRAALHQAQEYALNLSDFHEESRNRVVVPIALGAFKTIIPFNENAAPMQGASLSPKEVVSVIARAYGKWETLGKRIDPVAWNASRYFPVPSIIEAASAVYLDHDVKDLAYSRSGRDNLETTQNAIADYVRDARARNIKKLIVVTGVPGSGKTLAGLNAVQLLQKELDLEHEQASFLSGNGPLVVVLREALKRSAGRRKKGVARSVQSRIREMHRFVRDSYNDSRPPVDKLIVFDEAQRAWTAEKNKKKFGRDIAEPEMVLEIMGRHSGWAVIVALVGGGQEIHGGEAGLAAWGDAIAKHHNWEVATSPEALHGGHSVAGSRLFRSAYSQISRIAERQELHLAISKRSFETEISAAWVNAVLDGRYREASNLAASDSLPIYLTRDISAARSWLRSQAHGHRRTGLVASSSAARLRAEGVEPPTFSFLGGIDYSKWFLEPEGDYRSSSQLEVALSEFELQGLELDLVGLLWGGDLLFTDGQVVTRRLSGQKWRIVEGTGDPQSSADDPRTRILNKYRVLMTRFRKSMVIFVPTGSYEDPTRLPGEFDAVYNYLCNCGAKTIEIKRNI
jgi:hypothetical protein